MMKIGIISFSIEGRQTANRIADGLLGSKEGSNSQYKITVSSKSRYIRDSIQERLSQWTEKNFQDKDALIFVSSCGIAVRAIASFVISKKTDPAVIVVDEKAINVISLLSGHIGGANDLTRDISRLLGANCVITTATDINGKPAPDVFAKRNNLVIDNFEDAKNCAASSINGDDFNISITPFLGDHAKAADTLWLIPPVSYVGIGCRRGTSEDKIHEAVRDAFRVSNVDLRSVRQIASATIKADEKGLLSFCERYGYKVDFFPEEELAQLEGSFTESKFVREITGVGSICERSAMLAASKDNEQTSDETGKKDPYIHLRKYVRDGVTVAIAIREREYRYE
ncbi:MAG: cobalamin biosynthesis protein [Bacillota bacterium]|nr:cobalamin biosynthesis protein [Bacillota bacterium]